MSSKYTNNFVHLLIMLLGMAGMGKTTLSIQLAHQLKEEFDYIIFRSLQNAPTSEIILNQLNEFLAQEGHNIKVPLSKGDLGGSKADLGESKLDFLQLLSYLRSSRCLIIFDHLDAIFAKQQRAGKYRENYQQYGKIIQMIGATTHQSCLIITSRAKTQEIALLEGFDKKVHCFIISGCSDVNFSIFKAQNLSGSDQEKQELSKCYGDNALALKMISLSINNLFAGNISLFLSQKIRFFSQIKELFESQFIELSSLEKELICWLAINHQSLKITELHQYIVPAISTKELLETIES